MPRLLTSAKLGWSFRSSLKISTFAMAQKKMTKFGRIMFDHNQEDNNYRVHQECVPEHLTWRRVFITSRGGEISRSKCANQMANIEAHNQTPLSHYLSNFGISNQHCQQGQIKHRKLYTNLHIDNKSIISERIQAKPSNKTPASGAYRHLLAAVGFLSIVVAGLASGQQLPTVIVRGFLVSSLIEAQLDDQLAS